MVDSCRSDSVLREIRAMRKKLRLNVGLMRREMPAKNQQYENTRVYE
jgi:hypothetical protein